MEYEKSSENMVEGWLADLDLSLLADWDVLVFLYSHRASLASAEQIARLVGYTAAVVGDALDRLESRGFVKRSRASQGVRLYRFLDSASPSHDGFRQLLNLATNRSGRLLLVRKLRERAGQQASGRQGLELVSKGSAPWPNAV